MPLPLCLWYNRILYIEQTNRKIIFVNSYYYIYNDDDELTDEFVSDPYPVSKLRRRYDEAVDERHDRRLIVRRLRAFRQGPLQLADDHLQPVPFIFLVL